MTGVDADKANDNGVGETIFTMMPGTLEFVLHRIKEIEIICQAAYRYESVNKKLVELDKESERLNPGDPAIKLLSDPILQESNKFPLHEGALRALRTAFGRRTVFGDSW